MTGPIFDYAAQTWTAIDTDTDEKLSDHHFRTPDGVEYETSPDGAQYRNR